MVRLVCLLVLAATPAWAHGSLVPHEHPHGWSGFPARDALLIGVVLGALALAMIARMRRGKE